LNRLPSRKVIILAVILLVITIGVLWYVGKKNRTERERKQDQIMAELLEKNKNLREIVEGNLKEKGSLQSFNSASLFEGEEIKINTLETVTISDLKNYAENLAEIFKPLTKSRKNEVRIMLDALDNNNRTLTKEIVSARLTFEQIITALSQTSTPGEMATIQKNIVLTLKKMSALTAQMEKVVDEPVLALESGQTYLTEIEKLTSFIKTLNDYLLKTGAIGPENKIIVVFEKE